MRGNVTQTQHQVLLFWVWWGRTWFGCTELPPNQHFQDELEIWPRARPHHPTSVLDSLMLLWLNGSKSLQPGSQTWWKVWEQRSGVLQQQSEARGFGLRCLTNSGCLTCVLVFTLICPEYLMFHVFSSAFVCETNDSLSQKLTPSGLNHQYFTLTVKLC